MKIENDKVNLAGVPLVSVVVKEDPGLLVAEAMRLTREVEELRDEIANKELEIGVKVNVGK